MYAIFKFNLKIKYSQCTFLMENWCFLACGTPFKWPAKIADIKQASSAGVVPRPPSEIPGPKKLAWVGSTIAKWYQKGKFIIQKNL